MGNYKNKQEFEQRILNFQNLIKEGYNRNRAAKIANIASITAYKYSKDLIINNKNVNLTNHDYFNSIDTETKAYLLGFLLADGNISDDNRISICNAIDDIEIIKLFKEEICPENCLKIKKNLNKKDSCSIRFSSKNISEILNNKFNIKPRKTYDFNFKFPFENLDEKYIRHFVRGFFDGDGSIGSKHIEFIGTSFDFMLQLEDIFKNYINCTCNRRIRKTKNTTQYYIYLNGLHWKEIIKRVYNWFYEDSNVYLQRKKVKFENYLNTVLN